MTDDVDILTKRIKKLTRLLVGHMGMERTLQGVARSRERAKSYPAGDWLGIVMRETADNMMEVVQSYQSTGWPSRESVEAERLNDLAQEARLEQEAVN